MRPLPTASAPTRRTALSAALSDDGIDLMLDVFQRTPGLYDMFCDHCGGAYSRMPRDATAFPRRDMAFILAIWSGWPTADGVDEKVAKMRAAWQELEPLTQGFYTNYVGSDTVDRRLPRELRRELRAARRAQVEVRPDEPVPAERERAAEGLTARRQSGQARSSSLQPPTAFAVASIFARLSATDGASAVPSASAAARSICLRDSSRQPASSRSSARLLRAAALSGASRIARMYASAAAARSPSA